jgi:opacity protein-like surface antigen
MSSIRKTLLCGAGLAAASLSLAGGVAHAAPEPGAEQLKIEQSASELAEAAKGTTIAQTYIPLVGDVGNSSFEQATGWYFTAGVGASKPADRSWQDNVDDFNANGNVQYGGGIAADGGIGYDFGAVRTELTYSYNRASLNDISVRCDGCSGALDINGSGIVNKNDVFGSVYLDVPFGRWIPYIGGGIGYTNISTPGFTVSDFRFGSTNRGLFGWQAKAGIAYAVDYNWDVYAEGVYQGAGGSTIDDVRFGSFNNWGGKLGFRYRFAQRPVAVVEPAPAPAPAPEPAPMPMPEPAPAPAPIRGLW